MNKTETPLHKECAKAKFAPVAQQLEIQPEFRDPGSYHQVECVYCHKVVWTNQPRQKFCERDGPCAKKTRAQWRKPHAVAKHRVLVRKWRAANPEKRLAWERQWRDKHRTELNEQMRRRRAAVREAKIAAGTYHRGRPRKPTDQLKSKYYARYREGRTRI